MKLFKKLAVAVVGAVMALGVGIGVNAGAKGVPAKAGGDVTVTLTASEFATLNNMTASTGSSIGSVIKSGKLDDNISVSFEGSGNTASYWSSDIRIYGTKSTTSGTVTISAQNDCTLKSVKLTYTTANSATINHGSNVDITPSGNSVTYTITSGSSKAGQLKITAFSATYSSGPVSQDPSVTVDESVSFNAGNRKGISVKASSTNIQNSVYTWTTSSQDIQLENANSDTVKVLSVGLSGCSATINLNVSGTDSSGDSVSIDKEVAVTVEAPHSVAEALQLAGANGVYTRGIISSINQISTSYGNATYFISDDGEENDELEIYRGAYIDGADFTSEDQLEVGNEVVVYGNITNYKGTIEYTEGNYLTYIKSSPKLSLSVSSIELTVGTTETVTAIPVSFASGVISYSNDSDSCATLSYSGNTITVEGLAVGSHDFTITGNVGGVAQASVTLSVTVVAAYPTNINRTGYANYTDVQTFAEGSGSLKITYSDNSTSTKHLGDEGVKLLIDGNETDISSLTKDYKGKTAAISYTENGHTVTTGNYNLNITVELEVTSFEGTPEYLLTDTESAKNSAAITVNYISVNGEPTLSLVSSNSDNLQIEYDPSDNIYFPETNEGCAEFMVIAGTTPGQYSVTASITIGSRTETKSFSIIVRSEEPKPAGGSYQLITSLDDITNGNYVIAGKVGNDYFGMGNSISGGKIDGNALTVSQEKITSTITDNMVYSITSTANGFTIKNGTNYLKYSGSTNLAFDSSSYYWSFEKGVNGTFRALSATDGRGLFYRAGSTNKFGGYASSNATATSTEYYDIELFKYVEESGSAFDLVGDFVSTFMHMNDISIGNTSDTGACKGATGYYLSAKKGWNTMVSSYDGEDDLLEVFSESYADAYARFLAWAAACGDANPFDGNDSIANSKLSVLANTDSTTAVAVVVSLVSISTIAGYFFLRKKKETF